MRIESLTCNRSRYESGDDGQAYIATAQVRSDSVTQTAIGYGDDPEQASKSAFDLAVAKFTTPLRETIRIEVSLKF